MPSGAAARRYAQAVFELAHERGNADLWHRDLQMFTQVLADRRVEAFFLDPKRGSTEKQETARRMFEGRVQPEALNLLLMLVNRGRVDLVSLIADRFVSLVRDAAGIVTAEVTTAIEIDDQERQRIADQLSRITGKRVQVETRVDPAIIGGMVARIGDQLIDGSVVTSLQQLRQRLT